MSAVVPDPATQDWVPLWSLGGPGSMVFIEEKVAAAAVASFDFQNIPQTFKHLMVKGILRGDSAASAVNVWTRFNGDSGANYDYESFSFLNASPGAVGAAAAAQIVGTLCPGASARANRPGLFELTVPHYADTTFEKVCEGRSTSLDPVVPSEYWAGAAGAWRSTAAINRVTVLPSAGNFVAGSKLTLYGLTDWYPATQPPVPAMQLLGESVLGADSATLEVASIPQTYRTLKVIAKLRSTHTAYVQASVKFNNEASNVVDSWQGLMSVAGFNYAAPGLLTVGSCGFAPGSDAAAGLFASMEMEIPDYANATDVKMYSGKESHHSTLTGGCQFGGRYAKAAGIDRVALLTGAGVWRAGSKLQVYGIA